MDSVSCFTPCTYITSPGPLAWLLISRAALAKYLPANAYLSVFACLASLGPDRDSTGDILQSVWGPRRRSCEGAPAGYGDGAFCCVGKVYRKAGEA